MRFAELGLPLIKRAQQLARGTPGASFIARAVAHRGVRAVVLRLCCREPSCWRFSFWRRIFEAALTQASRYRGATCREVTGR
jgi:hypothetical protein